QHLSDVLGRRPEPSRLMTVIALARKYDRVIGQARQLKAVMEQVREVAKAGGLDEYGDVEIRSRYAKLSNRRFQALDFWLTEVSGKDVRTVDLTPVLIDEDENGVALEYTPIERTTRRGRLFSIAASRAESDREWIAKQFSDPDYASVPTGDRQDLVGVD